MRLANSRYNSINVFRSEKIYFTANEIVLLQYGRDWYDMEWYIRNGVALNLEHFLQRATESGDWSET
jgi:hypothetical protein